MTIPFGTISTGSSARFVGLRATKRSLDRRAQCDPDDVFDRSFPIAAYDLSAS
jgi:hypothetical protein